jgi:hypothetical protein
MANKKISQLTAKGTALAATDLVEISESDGAGGYVSKSVTGANVVSGLQATLVSATNIKTINSNSILGSGDLVISGGGGGIHVLTEPVSGRLYNARTTGTNGSNTLNPSANTITLYPFIPANTITVSNLQANVVTATASGLIRILVYSDLNGVPSSKLIESTNLDCSTTGVKTYTTSYTFTAGTTYWLGYYANAVLNGMSSVPGVELTPISAYTGGFTAASITVTAAATFPTAPSTLGTASPVISAGLLINLTAA